MQCGCSYFPIRNVEKRYIYPLCEYIKFISDYRGLRRGWDITIQLELDCTLTSSVPPLLGHFSTLSPSPSCLFLGMDDSLNAETEHASASPQEEWFRGLLILIGKA
jgi:hypothetical protein